MSKLRAFVQLDFVTVKPYFNARNMLIYIAMAAFLTTFSKNAASGMGVGMMLGTMFMGYPFILGEKNNMDALYATLAVKRETVVLGRYLFALLLNLLATLVSVCLGIAGTFLLGQAASQPAIPASGAVEVVFALSALFLLIQSVQLPVYFKLGYAKARFLSMLPTFAVAMGYAIILKNPVSGALHDFLKNSLNRTEVNLILIAALFLAVFISFRLSVAFYKKREF